MAEFADKVEYAKAEIINFLLFITKLSHKDMTYVVLYIDLVSLVSSWLRWIKFALTLIPGRSWTC